MEDQNNREDTNPETPIQNQPVDNVPPVTPIQDQARDDIPPLKPANWLWQSIAATILCCNILGVIGVVYAARVDTLYYNFKYAEAEKASKNARMWTLISVALGILTLVLWGVLSTSSEFMSAMEGIIENNASGYNF